MVVLETPLNSLDMVIDKQWLSAKFTEGEALIGSTVDQNITIEQLHQMMLADGIRPEDNSLSREIIRTRYPDDFEQDGSPKEV